MKLITGIYKITSPSGRIYIGQSIDVKKRWVFYKKPSFLNYRSNQTKLKNSLSKHGPEGKSCTLCKEFKSLSEFYKRSSKSHLYKSRCIECLNSIDLSESKKKYKLKQQEQASDVYVLEILRLKTGLKTSELRKCPKLIEAQRIQLLTNRILKKCRN